MDRSTAILMVMLIIVLIMVMLVFLPEDDAKQAGQDVASDDPL
jgi:succinate dehydrogenase hydrophobic anchor subunit